jgi:ribulose-phosphate 3-epimerase
MSRRSCLDSLRQSAPVVLPSLLLCDFGNLEREVRRLEQAGVQALHLDVMDGHFVRNFTYGLPIVAALRRLTDLPLDVHLMIAQPDQQVGAFYEAGADILTVHIEATSDPRSLLTQIRELGAGAGIALNPDTPLKELEPCLELADLVLVMSVPAGYGGQKFHEVALEKLRSLRPLVRPEVLLEVDGGINELTISRAAEAGARLFVVGSAIFGQQRYDAAVAGLARLASAANRSSVPSGT